MSEALRVDLVAAARDEASEQLAMTNDQLRKLNAELKASAKISADSATGVTALGKSYLGAQEGVNRVKGKFDELFGIIAFATPVVAAIGSAIVDAFGGPSTRSTLDAFSMHLTEMERQTARLGADVERFGKIALESRIALLNALGRTAEAQALIVGKALDAEEEKVKSARTVLKLIEEDISSSWDSAEERLVEAQARARRLEAELVQRRRMLEAASTSGDERAQSAAMVQNTQRLSELGREIADAKSHERRAAADLEKLEGHRVKMVKTIADLQATAITPQVQEQARLAGVVASAQQQALKAQASTASAVVRLLTEQKASSADLRRAQEDEFTIRKAIGLAEVGSLEVTLEGEQEKVRLAAQQLALRAAMGGMNAETARQLADAGKAAASLEGALGALARQRELLQGAAFSAPSRGGGGGGDKAEDMVKSEKAALRELELAYSDTIGKLARAETEYTQTLSELSSARVSTLERETRETLALLKLQAAQKAANDEASAQGDRTKAALDALSRERTSTVSAVAAAREEYKSAISAINESQGDEAEKAARREIELLKLRRVEYSATVDLYRSSASTVAELSPEFYNLSVALADVAKNAALMAAANELNAEGLINMVAAGGKSALGLIKNTQARAYAEALLYSGLATAAAFTPGMQWQAVGYGAAAAALFIAAGTSGGKRSSGSAGASSSSPGSRDRDQAGGQSSNITNVWNIAGGTRDAISLAHLSRRADHSQRHTGYDQRSPGW